MIVVCVSGLGDGRGAVVVGGPVGGGLVAGGLVVGGLRGGSWTKGRTNCGEVAAGCCGGTLSERWGAIVTEVASTAVAGVA